MPVSGIALAKNVADHLEGFFLPSKHKDENGKPLYQKCRWIVFQIVAKEEGPGEVINIKEKGPLESTFDDLVAMLSETPAAYVVYEFIMPDKDQSKAGQLTYPIFITWVNDAICPVNMKMKMSSSESVIKDKCKSQCKLMLSLHDVSEVNFKEILAALVKAAVKY